ncbi:MAG: hypothetical protein Q8P33_01275, partial [bacterium]|nr:hypothetical protein [bacterium]
MIFSKLVQAIPVNPPGERIELPGSTTGETITAPIVDVINWGLLVAGGVAVLVLIISGFFYITAAGNEKNIERAKAGIRGAIIGIIIMLLSAIIVNTINYA